MQIYLSAKNQKALKWAWVFAAYLVVLVILWVALCFVDRKVSDTFAILAVVAAMQVARFLDYARRGKISLISLHAACVGMMIGCAIVNIEKGNPLGGVIALSLSSTTLLLGPWCITERKNYRAMLLGDFRVKELAAWSILAFVVVTVVSLNAVDIMSKEAQYAIFAAIITLVIVIPVMQLLRVGKRFGLKNKAIAT